MMGIIPLEVRYSQNNPGRLVPLFKPSIRRMYEAICRQDQAAFNALYHRPGGHSNLLELEALDIVEVRWWPRYESGERRDLEVSDIAIISEEE